MFWVPLIMAAAGAAQKNAEDGKAQLDDPSFDDKYKQPAEGPQAPQATPLTRFQAQDDAPEGPSPAPPPGAPPRDGDDALKRFKVRQEQSGGPAY